MTPGDSTHSQDAAQAQWFYHDGQEPRGPMSTEKLMTAVRQGRVTATTRVALATEQVWRPAGELEGLIPPESASSSRTDARHAQPTTASTQAMREALQYLHQQDVRRAGIAPTGRRLANVSVGFAVQRLIRPVIEAVGAALERTLSGAFTVFSSGLRSKVVLGFVAAGLLGWGAYSLPRQGISQQDAHSTLRRMVHDFRSLRDTHADAIQWDEFNRRTREELAVIVPQLEASARVEDPASLQLLWISRDYLPSILSEARTAPNLAEQQLDAQFAGLADKLEHRQTTSVVFEGAAIGIIGLDALILLAGGVWWWRRSH